LPTFHVLPFRRGLPPTQPHVDRELSPQARMLPPEYERVPAWTTPRAGGSSTSGTPSI